MGTTVEALIAKWRDHGTSVNNWYNELCDNPDQIGIEKVIIFFKNYQKEDLSKYHINHDMGKPYVRVVDSDGREHYPNHSQESHRRYIQAFGEDVYSDLILHDMDFHTRRGDDLKDVWGLPYADHLYATAWAEIYANCQLFGGVESDSFKIKRKRLIQALKCRLRT